MEQAAHVLGLEATFFFIPGIMMICFGDMQPRTLLVRCPQGFDMGKLAKVTGIANAICHKKLPLQECIDKLEDIAQASPTWGPLAILMAHTVSSLLTTPVMFNGSWMDTAVSGGLGLMVGTLTLVAGKYASYCNIFEISTAILVAFVAKALNPWICFTGVSLSATATLLPGYILTMSIVRKQEKFYALPCELIWLRVDGIISQTRDYRHHSVHLCIDLCFIHWIRARDRHEHL